MKPLPENLSPSCVSIKAYVKMLRDVNTSRKKKMGAVPSATDCQKDEAKVRFVEMKRKAEAETKVKDADGEGKKGSASRAYWHKHPKKNAST